MSKILIDRSTVEQALEALETLVPTKGPSIYNSARDALRTALAQQEEPSQEPVATLIAQRDALLEALIKCRDRFFPADQPERDRDELWEPVTAAIKAAEGEKK